MTWQPPFLGAKCPQNRSYQGGGFDVVLMWFWSFPRSFREFSSRVPRIIWLKPCTNKRPVTLANFKKMTFFHFSVRLSRNSTRLGEWNVSRGIVCAIFRGPGTTENSTGSNYSVESFVAFSGSILQEFRFRSSVGVSDPGEVLVGLKVSDGKNISNISQRLQGGSHRGRFKSSRGCREL